MKFKKIKRISVKLIFVFLIFNLILQFIHFKQLNINKQQELKAIQKKVDAQEKINSSLLEQINLKYDDEQIKEFARDNLNLIEPLERVFVNVSDSE